MSEFDDRFIGKSIDGFKFKLFKKNGKLIKGSTYSFNKGKGPFEVKKPPYLLKVDKKNKELYFWCENLNKLVVLCFNKNKIKPRKEIYYNVKGKGGGSVYIGKNNNIYVVNVFSHYRIIKYNKKGEILDKFIKIDYPVKQDMHAMLKHFHGLSVIGDYFILFGFMNGKIKFYKKSNGTLKLVKEKYAYDFKKDKEIKIEEVKDKLKNVIGGKKIDNKFCISFFKDNERKETIREIFSKKGKPLYYQIIENQKKIDAVNIIQSGNKVDSLVYYQKKKKNNYEYDRVVVAKLDK